MGLTFHRGYQLCSRFSVWMRRFHHLRNGRSDMECCHEGRAGRVWHRCVFTDLLGILRGELVYLAFIEIHQMMSNIQKCE